jgi:hypothetical protein
MQLVYQRQIEILKVLALIHVSAAPNLPSMRSPPIEVCKNLEHWENIENTTKQPKNVREMCQERVEEGAFLCWKQAVSVFTSGKDTRSLKT